MAEFRMSSTEGLGSVLSSRPSCFLNARISMNTAAGAAVAPSA